MSTPRPRADAGTLPSSAGQRAFSGTQRFEIRRIIGEGGMGVVYEALDRERGMPVAIKTLRHLDAQGLFRFKTEFRSRADLEHRNLVRLGELHKEAGSWFFTMELVDGQPFLDWVTREAVVHHDDPTMMTPTSVPVVESTQEVPLVPPGQGFDEGRLRAALRQLVHGLDALHRAGKIHRDLKPSNVLVTPKGRVVILDFGLIADLAPRDVSDPTVVGTAGYMAPEQAMASQGGAAADWYSVGVMIYEALTGRLPIDGQPLEILMRKQRELPPAPETIAAVPADLSSLCMALLAIDPAARPTAAEILRRLAASPAAIEEAQGAFVGRGAELATLTGALEDSRRGGNRVLCLEGESGIGKSALVRYFVDHVARLRSDTLVLAGRCHERENVPFKGLDGVVDAAARWMARHGDEAALPPAPEVAALAELFPVLLRVPAIVRRTAALPPSPLELRARAFRGLRQLLAGLGSRRTLVITIDDVQWADADSMALLRELLQPPAMPHLLLILTRREGEPLDLPGTVDTVPLPPLDVEEAAALIELVAPERLAETASLVAGSGGHPMFLRELLRHLAPPRSARLHDALWARISRMDSGARRMLEVVAVAGRPLPQWLITDTLNLDARTTAKLLSELRAASLVRTRGTRAADPVEPYHDRVRDAVVAHVPPPRRARYHARLASLLIASGLVDKDPLAVVNHLE
ncbi:MAG: AAA family ATPase, partial [Myxococcales bacterium]|nr:AAA family ATPase [Myxococcales bacterium]